MKHVQRSQAYLRKRKMMMVLPLLVIPFLTMAFWALGGGSTATTEKIQTQGLNLKLPNANLKNEFSDKLSFYDQADKDSMKLAELMRNDPYYRHQDSMQNVYLKEMEQVTQSSAEKFKLSPILQSDGLKVSPYDKVSSPAEDKVMRKLAELNSALNQPEKNVSKDDMTEQQEGMKNLNFGNEVDKLEGMMRNLNKANGEDPEIKQLDGTLEKILDVQHPERVKDRIRQQSLKDKGTVFPITRIKEDNTSLLDTGKKELNTSSGFFGPGDESLFPDGDNAIQAVIHEDQSLVNGSVVKLRLLNDVYVNGSLIPKGNFVFGIASMNAERLKVEINSIRCNQSLYPVKLEVYDIDGLAGIYIPGAITRDVAKQSADNSLQLMELSTMDPSLKAQAAAAGIGAAKNLLIKKTKMVKVFVKAGYKVLLK
ncbi:MAG TPA: conjugative transposon protein TraM [Chitinophagaceae bacterium]|nr:conjugative transposon protein TraM [Chitinophagaceae bacterium]